MLCPLTQNTMGGIMYSMHTGHSSSLSRPCLKALVLIDRLLNILNMSCKQGRPLNHSCRHEEQFNRRYLCVFAIKKFCTEYFRLSPTSHRQRCNRALGFYPHCNCNCMGIPRVWGNCGRNVAQLRKIYIYLDSNPWTWKQSWALFQIILPTTSFLVYAFLSYYISIFRHTEHDGRTDIWITYNIYFFIRGLFIGALSNFHHITSTDKIINKQLDEYCNLLRYDTVLIGNFS